MGLARFSRGEYHKVVLMNLGLVPAQAFRASRSEAAPYGSDNGKPKLKSKDFIREAVCFKSWGSFQSASSRKP